MKKLIVFIFIIISSNSLEAQINSDSLWNVWNDMTQTAEDRIIAIDKIIYNNYLFVKPDSAFVLAQDMYHFAVENKLEKNIGGAPSCSSSQNISSSSEENYDWEIVKTDKNDSPSWIIYTRKIASTNFLEYKIFSKSLYFFIQAGYSQSSWWYRK